MWYFMAAGKYVIFEYLLFIASFSQRLNRTQKYVQSILYTNRALNNKSQDSSLIPSFNTNFSIIIGCFLANIGHIYKTIDIS